MPGQGQKSVTLPADLVDQVARRLTVSGHKTLTDFIKEAIREKLAGPAASTLTTDVDHQQDRPSDSKQPTSSQGSVAMSSEVDPPSGRSPRPESGSEGAAADQPLSRDSAASAPERVHATRDVLDDGRDGDRGRDTRSTEAGTAPRLPDGPVETTVVAKPVVEIRTSHPVTNSEDKKIVREVAKEIVKISTWTCPECHVAMPLTERLAHRATHKTRGDRDSGSATATAAHSTVATSSSPATPATVAARPVVPVQRRISADVDRLVRYVRMLANGQNVRLETDVDRRRELLIVAVQLGHRDQNLSEPSDVDASELLTALAARDAVIERALEPRESLSMPTPTNKGGARGRK